MTHASAFIDRAHYATTIDAGGHRMIADEPSTNGGADAGPGPYELLCASLCACTAITLRMYADRKQWDMTSCKVEAHFVRDADKTERIERTLHLEGTLDDEQRHRIADIAEKTPVTLTLKRGFDIATTLAE